MNSKRTPRARNISPNRCDKRKQLWVLMPHSTILTTVFICHENQNNKKIRIQVVVVDKVLRGTAVILIRPHT